MKYSLKFNYKDIFVIVFSFILIIMFLIFSLLGNVQSSSDIVVVRYNNQIVKKMPINIDSTFTMYKKDYPDLYGDELEITIKNNKVSITKEDSPFHYCSKLGEINNRGSSLICAPNCVRVTIEKGEGNVNNSSSDDYDFRV